MAGNDNNVNAQTSNGTSTVWQIVGRLIAAAIILAITAFLHLDSKLIIFGL